MATFDLSNNRFPEGTSVGLYSIDQFNMPSGPNTAVAPPGSATASATVTSGVAAFTGVDPGDYYAYAAPGGVKTYVRVQVGQDDSGTVAYVSRDNTFSGANSFSATLTTAAIDSTSTIAADTSVTSATIAGTTAVVTPSVGTATADDLAIVTDETAHINISATGEIGFFGATAAAQPDAFTQTYATADRTHEDPTAEAVAETAAATSAYGYAEAQANAIPVAINALIDDVANIKQVLNALIEDHVALGLCAAE